MKRTLLFSLFILCLGPTTSARAENSIGAWRWLGMGWGPGYHAGASTAKHHGHRSYGQKPAPTWNQAWPETIEAVPTPAEQPLPAGSALRAGHSPDQQAAIWRDSQRRAGLSPSQPALQNPYEGIESARKSRNSQ